MQVRCEIITLDHRKQDGPMFNDDSMTFNKLVAWVERNCPGYGEIKIRKDEIMAIYEDRVETYYIKK